MKNITSKLLQSLFCSLALLIVGSDLASAQTTVIKKSTLIEQEGSGSREIGETLPSWEGKAIQIYKDQKSCEISSIKKINGGVCCKKKVKGKETECIPNSGYSDCKNLSGYIIDENFECPSDCLLNPLSSPSPSKSASVAVSKSASKAVSKSPSKSASASKSQSVKPSSSSKPPTIKPSPSPDFRKFACLSNELQPISYHEVCGIHDSESICNTKINPMNGLRMCKWVIPRCTVIYVDGRPVSVTYDCTKHYTSESCLQRRFATGAKVCNWK